MKIIIAAIVFLSLSSFLFAQSDVQKKLQTQLIVVENNNTITIEAGKFTFDKSLSLEGKKNITIRGEGVDKTILSFKGQTQGAEGLKISNCETIILENLTVQDAKGDCIKAMNVKNITFRNVKAEWTGKPSKKNGGYAIYPVQCQGVMIENCIAIGASDSGIYVGQSKDIVVRKCKAYHNVAGIEIENSINADVYENEATENTGGILVFDLPDLVQKKGGNVRVYKNNIHHNNFSNFAPKGNIVGKVPKGTGILILATNHVEIFDNQIINNMTCGTGIISYFMTENPIKDKDYYPYPTGIYIHDNTYARENTRTTSQGRFGKIFRFKLHFGKNVPHIIYDGIVDQKTLDVYGKANIGQGICIVNNKNASFANIDAANNFKNISNDVSRYNCNPSSIWNGIPIKDK